MPEKKRTRAAISAQENFGEGLCQELEVLLAPDDIQIAFDRKTGIQQLSNQPSECLIPFLVSKLFEFGAEKIITSAPGRVGFKVKPDAFLAAKTEMIYDIREKVAGKATIGKLAFATATSRIFIFEIYYAGSFKLKREFTDNEIKTAGGVGQALEDFFSEVEQSLEGSGITAIQAANKTRRSRNNEYLFHFSYQPTLGFYENEVYGAGCYSVRGDATLDEINGYGVDSKTCELMTQRCICAQVLKMQFTAPIWFPVKFIISTTRKKYLILMMN